MLTTYKPFTSVCGCREYLYVIGSVSFAVFDAPSSDRQFKAVKMIEKRRKSGGELVKAWIYSPSHVKDFYDCIAVNDLIYVVGYYRSSEHSLEWVVAALDTDLRLVKIGKSDLLEPYSVAYRVTSDGEYLYVAGLSGSSSSVKWRVEKRVIDDLSIIKSHVSEPAGGTYFVSVNDVGVNPVTSHVWVVEYSVGDDDVIDRIEILSRDLEPIRVLEKVGTAPPTTFRDREHLDYVGGELTSTLTFDEEGFAYIGGFGYVAKYDMYGNRIKKVRHEGRLKKSSYINGRIYVAGERVVEGRVTHFISVFDRELSLLDEVDLSNEVDTNPDSRPGDKIFYDESNLYLAEDFQHGWVVYSIKYKR